MYRKWGVCYVNPSWKFSIDNLRIYRESWKNIDNVTLVNKISSTTVRVGTPRVVEIISIAVISAWNARRNRKQFGNYTLCPLKWDVERAAWCFLFIAGHIWFQLSLFFYFENGFYSRLKVILNSHLSVVNSRYIFENKGDWTADKWSIFGLWNRVA
jgi:hypothetical protein